MNKKHPSVNLNLLNFIKKSNKKHPSVELTWYTKFFYGAPPELPLSATFMRMVAMMHLKRLECFGEYGLTLMVYGLDETMKAKV